MREVPRPQNDVFNHEGKNIGDATGMTVENQKALYERFMEASDGKSSEVIEGFMKAASKKELAFALWKSMRDVTEAREKEKKEDTLDEMMRELRQVALEGIVVSQGEFCIKTIENARKDLSSITASMQAHPDNQPDSEFADMVALGQRRIQELDETLESMKEAQSKLEEVL